MSVKQTSSEAKSRYRAIQQLQHLTTYRGEAVRGGGGGEVWDRRGVQEDDEGKKLGRVVEQLQRFRLALHKAQLNQHSSIKSRIQEFGCMIIERLYVDEP